MFNDPAFQQGPTVDKRGRKVVKNKNREDMHKYYKLRDQVHAPRSPDGLSAAALVLGAALVLQSLDRRQAAAMIMTLLQAGAGEQQEQKGQAAQNAVAPAPVRTPDAAKPSGAARKAQVLGKRKKGSAAEEEPAAARPEQLDLIAAGMCSAQYLVMRLCDAAVLVPLCSSGLDCLTC